jgi:DNA (cytosine-5)-methyltransferase 1
MRYASVCDGIGAAHVAWQPLGWQCSWTSEIEPFPAAVVEHRFGFPNVGDMTKITEEMLDGYGPVDLLVGGTPCQSFSVAGLRGGLADPRGNLALRFVQLAAVMQPKWIVWENVPGVLSSGKGRDFGTFLGALGELGYGFAYRVLDAQWFGVAQRRRRVFVVGHLGDWRRAAAVLFERESVFGNPPTRGAKGQRVTGAAESGPGGGLVWRGGDQANSEHCIDHAGTLNCDKGQQGGIVAFHPTQDPISSVDGSTHAMGCGSKGGCCTQAVAFTKSKRAQSTNDDETWVPGEVSPTMSCFDQGDTRATTVVAVDLQNVQVGGDLAGTLDTTRPSRGGGQAVAQGFTYSGYSNQPAWMTGDRTDCLPASGHSDGSHQGVGVVAFDTYNQTLNQTLRAGASEQAHEQVGAVFNGMAVRRLTPRECERLQGFPDDYTLVEYRKKPAADGPRYRALGNSMAVPVMRWIGERIALVDGK